jgi:hypothetical protein
MMADSIGSKDYMAVIVSKDSLNWSGINQQLNQNPRQDFASRLNNLLQDQHISAVHYQSSEKGNMQLNTDGPINGVITCVVELDKM